MDIGINRNRRRISVGLFVLDCLLLTGRGSAQDLPAITLDPVVSGLTSPVQVTHAGDESGRLFIVEQEGRVLIYQNGTLLGIPFLDIRDRVTSGGEKGLLSIVFHPDYPRNRRFFLNYTNRRPNLKSFIVEYQVSVGNPNLALREEKIVMQFDQPFDNHNGGQLKFGPDGYLYIGTGDGGSAGDPMRNGQNRQSLLGKILRIDVDHGTGYVIPPGNPFMDGSGVPEIWAYGFRNPWRFSFDRLNGRLLVGDVGQNDYEEIDLIRRGENYGWNIMEGTHCYPPGTGCETAGLILPIAEYAHDLGVSVTGGYVYRGRQYPALTGTYIFGDFGSSRIWGLQETPLGNWKRTELLVSGLSISSFGEDEEGELYVVGYEGSLRRLRTLNAPGEEYLQVLVPSAAKTDRFVSSLTILNRDAVTQPVIIRSRSPEGSLTGSLNLELAPGGLFRSEDILALLQLPSGSFGPLILEAPHWGSISATSEIRSNRGTAGFFPGQPGSGGSREKIIAEVEDSGERGTKGTHRSNLGINNTGTLTATVEVSLVDSEGSVAGAATYGVPPGGMVQVNQIVRTLRKAGGSQIDHGYLRLVSNQPVYAWASKIDNETDDPSMEIGIGDELSGTGTQLMVPSISGTGRFKSLLAVINREDTPNQIRLVARAASGAVMARVSRTIPPKGVFRSTDILSEMGVLSESFGSLLVESLSEKLLSVVSEVHSAQGTAGFFPAVTTASAALRSYLPEIVDTGDASNPGTYRTNVGINNLGALPARVKLDVFDSSGMRLGSTTLEVPVDGLIQINRVVASILGRRVQSVVYLGISSNQPIHAWASKINNDTDDPSVLISIP